MRTFLEIRASYENNPDAVSLSDPQSVNCDRDTLLHLASFRGNELDVRELAMLGARLDAHGDLGNTPLHYAAMNGHLSVASVLLGLGADHQVRNEFGETPAECAKLSGHQKLAVLLS